MPFASAQSLMTSKAKSMALASAVKIKKPLGRRTVLQASFKKVAQPPSLPSFEPAVKIK